MRFLYAEGKIVLSDYREYMKFHIFKGKWSRILRILIDMLIFFVLAWLLLTGIVSHSTTLIIIAGSGFLCYFMFQYLLRKHVKNTCLKKKEFMYATHAVEFGNNGLIYTVKYDPEHNAHKYEDTEQRYHYNEFWRVFETANFFYFYPDKRFAVIVPKRNMTFENEGKLKTLLKERLGKSFVHCL